MASGTGCINVSNTKIGGCALLGSQSIGILPSCNRGRGGGGGGGGRSTLPMRSSKIQNHHHHHHRSCLVLAQSRDDHTQQQQQLQSESNICSTLLLPSSSLMLTSRQLEASGLPFKQAESIVKVMLAYLSSLAQLKEIGKMRRQLEVLGVPFKQAEAIITVVVMNVAAHSAAAAATSKEEEMEKMMGQLEASGLPSNKAERIVKALVQYFSSLPKIEIGKMKRQLKASGLQSKQVQVISTVVMYMTPKVTEEHGGDSEKIVDIDEIMDGKEYSIFQPSNIQKSSSEDYTLKFLDRTIKVLLILNSLPVVLIFIIRGKLALLTGLVSLYICYFCFV